MRFLVEFSIPDPRGPSGPGWRVRVVELQGGLVGLLLMGPKPGPTAGYQKIYIPPVANDERYRLPKYVADYLAGLFAPGEVKTE